MNTKGFIVIHTWANTSLIHQYKTLPWGLQTTANAPTHLKQVALGGSLYIRLFWLRCLLLLFILAWQPSSAFFKGFEAFRSSEKGTHNRIIPSALPCPANTAHLSSGYFSFEPILCVWHWPLYGETVSPPHGSDPTYARSLSLSLSVLCFWSIKEKKTTTYFTGKTNRRLFAHSCNLHFKWAK